MLLGVRHHTMDRDTICGGTADFCYKVTPDGWVKTNTLIHKREYHSSWEVEEGIILFGGKHSPNTTEIAMWNGTSQEMFSLPYDIGLMLTLNIKLNVMFILIQYVLDMHVQSLMKTLL